MLEAMRRYFSEGNTLSLSFRKLKLTQLLNTVKENESSILSALKSDLGKCESEAYCSEIALVIKEIEYALKQLPRWMQKTKTKTPLLFWPSTSYQVARPKGVVLIIGPWNYPFLLMMLPLVGAIAAGNAVILKPSEHAQQTALIINKLIDRVFENNHCQVQLGNQTIAKQLLEYKWDHIFFTGSSKIGYKILKSAASHLTPTTLELGGKSPVIVMNDADIKVSSKRIAWGKFINAGQTCIAPDTLYCHEDIYKDILGELNRTLTDFFGKDPEKSPDYGRIINEQHLNRLIPLLKDGTVIAGGRFRKESLYLSPTLLTDVNEQSAIMKEEIFGPILPVIPFKDLDLLIGTLKNKPEPLALYLFTKSNITEKKVLNNLQAGTVAINNTIKQGTTRFLPFGGIGDSGMGSYHGKSSFITFSHLQSIMKESYKGFSFHYPPYKTPLSTLRKIFRWFG